MSALDARSERLVQDGLAAGHTISVIAHRLSTVHQADKILVLDHGSVREIGTHDALMARGGRYRELMSHLSGERL